MCNPLLILSAASTALGIGQTVMDYRGQQQAYAANAAAANVNFRNRTEATARAASQAEASASEDAFSRAIERIAMEGRIASSISELGASGTSGFQLQRSSAFEFGRDASLAQVNLRNTRDQFSREMQGAEIARQSQINQVQRPTRSSLLLGLGGAAMGGVNTYTGLGGRIPGIS